jgi:phage tail protein domain
MASSENLSSSYLQYLPAIFSDDPFLGRFLLAFEHILTGCKLDSCRGLEETITDMAALFDPLQTPVEFLDWLAGWTALNLRGDWSEAQRRSFLSQIIPLYRWRGTKRGMVDLLKIYTGLEPTIREAEGAVFQIGVNATIGLNTQIGGTAPHYFYVQVVMPPNPAEIVRQQGIITALIDMQKPAHTDYELEIIHTTIQIGKRSTVGVDTLLGSATESG